MFMDPFIAAATQTSRPLVNPNDISTIFAYIPNIIEVSNVLAYRFESVAKSWHEQSSLVGAVFNQMENDFEVYIRYAVNFHHSQRCITRAHNNILYRRFIQESLRKKETNRMGLNDYMIIPIQRVTRYSLLLKGKYEIVIRNFVAVIACLPKKYRPQETHSTKSPRLYQHRQGTQDDDWSRAGHERCPEEAMKQTLAEYQSQLFLKCPPLFILLHVERPTLLLSH
jgi:hypothetical protein